MLDWAVIGLYVVFALFVGARFTKAASRGIHSFFVGDRNLPWWLAGTSMVATTFAADTPLAVTGLVASGGIAGNWLWWCWGIAHLTATFFFARLWRRSGVITDAEITEIRYGGSAASALRGFKALYNGVFINCLTMAWVIAAMVKISRAFFNVHPAAVIIVCVAISVAYTTLGGFRSVVITDAVQFSLGMIGALVLAVLVVHHFGGLGSLDEPNKPGLLVQLQQATQAVERPVHEFLDFVPGTDHPTTPLILFVVLLIAGWWRLAEGHGYIVQRLAACKDEGHAQGASLWFAIAHNALRPWPWIIVGLAALILYPMLPNGALPNTLKSQDGSIQISPAELDVATGGRLTLTGVPPGSRVEVMGQAVIATQHDSGVVADFAPFERSEETKIGVHAGGRFVELEGLRVHLLDREMAYPLIMGRFLPPMLLGLVIASLLAAFMSTIDTHTNWGASYLVRDVYQRFIRKDAPDAHYVTMSRWAIVLIASLAGLTALHIHNIADVWRFLVNLGAGLGSVTAARWYWHRVTPHAEFAAIGVTTLTTIVLQAFCTPSLFGANNPWLLHAIPSWAQILIIAGSSLLTWIPVSLWGPKNSPEALQRFADQVHPPGPGWRRWNREKKSGVGPALTKLIIGLAVVYGSLFGFGHVLIGSKYLGGAMLVAALGLLVLIVRSSTKVDRAC